jgi:hypothetical protein
VVGFKHMTPQIIQDLKTQDYAAAQKLVSAFKESMGFSPECLLVNGVGQFAEIVDVKQFYVTICNVRSGDLSFLPKHRILHRSGNPMMVDQYHV